MPIPPSPFVCTMEGNTETRSGAFIQVPTQEPPLYKVLNDVFLLQSFDSGIPRLDAFFATSVGFMKDESTQRLINANVALRQVFEHFLIII